MKKGETQKQSFQFVSVAGSTTDGTSKAEHRRLVRSNAANYQWSRQKKAAIRKRNNSGNSDNLSPHTSPTSYGKNSLSVSPGPVSPGPSESALSDFEVPAGSPSNDATDLSWSICPDFSELPSELFEQLTLLSKDDRLRNLMKHSEQFSYSSPRSLEILSPI